MEKVYRKLFNLPDLEPDWTFLEFCQRYIDNETFLMKEFSEKGYKVSCYKILMTVLFG